MLESLLVLLIEVFDVVNLIQGFLIVFVLMMVMGCYYYIVFFVVGVLLIDQFVMFVFNNIWNISIEDIVEQFWDKLFDFDVIVVII